MNSNSEIYRFILDNLQKIIAPKELIALNLSISQLELLALTLSDKFESITMGNLAQGMSVPVSTATGIVDRLVKKELVQRGSYEKDRRIVTVYLTDSGKDLVEEFKVYCYQFLDRVRNILTEEEFGTALQLWRKVMVGLQKGLPDLQEKPGGYRQSVAIE